MLRFLECRWVRRRLPLYSEGPLYPDESIQGEEKRRIESHLALCSRCQKELERYRLVDELLQAYLRKKRLYKALFGTDIDGNAESQNWAGRVPYLTRKYAIPMGVAACILLGLGVYFVSNLVVQPSQPSPVSVQAPAAQSHVQIGTYTIHHVYLCIDHDRGRDTRVLVNQQQIVTDNSHRMTVDLEGNHRMVLDFNTTVSINKTQPGYHIDLTRGRIWCSKEKSADTLIVKTTNSTIQVTGTTFGIDLTDPTRTILTVAEGNVVISSALESVRVTSGHQSIACMDQPPTEPSRVDAERLLTWHTQLGPLTITTPEPREVTREKLLSRQNKEDDYKWFYQLFESLLPLENALEERHVQVDRDILIGLSGAMFRASYPKDLNAEPPFSIPPYVPTKEAIENIALFYGYSYEWTDTSGVGTVPAVHNQSLLLKHKLPDTTVARRQAIINSLHLATKYANEPEDEHYYHGITAYEKWIEDIYKPRSLREEVSWAQNTIFYTTKTAEYLGKSKAVSQKYLTVAQQYIDDPETEGCLRRIAEAYEQEIPMIDSLSRIVLRIVEGGDLTSKNSVTDPCSELIPMDNQTKHDLEILLKEMVEKEREVIRCDIEIQRDVLW
jgi:hypothetical protein